MQPKQLIHRLLTFLILFCVSFLCFLFVCLCLLFFAVLITGAVTDANAFWEGVCHWAKITGNVGLRLFRPKKRGTSTKLVSLTGRTGLTRVFQ